MSLFQARQPRRYRPRTIYRDEQKERIHKLIVDVKRQQGEHVDEPYDTTKFNGTFSQYTPHAQRASENSHKLVWPVALMLIIVLLFVWHYLLTGKFHLL